MSTEIVWEPWRTDCLPEIGDYVQVDCYHERTDERRIFEGIIGGGDDRYMWFVGEKREPSTDWQATRWRRGLLPSHEVEKRREEVEA